MKRPFVAAFWKTDMETCIVYSSRTGNTRAVALHLAETFSLPVFSVESAPLSCERCILGFWTWRGGPDEAMRAFMEKLHGRSVFFFATMAAFPDSPHAARCALRTQALLESRECRVLGHFFCQGRLDPAVLARSTHPRTPERMARLAEAAFHPDARDFSAAARAVERALFSASPSRLERADAAALKRSA